MVLLRALEVERTSSCLIGMQVREGSTSYDRQCLKVELNSQVLQSRAAYTRDPIEVIAAHFGFEGSILVVIRCEADLICAI